MPPLARCRQRAVSPQLVLARSALRASGGDTAPVTEAMEAGAGFLPDRETAKEAKPLRGQPFTQFSKYIACYVPRKRDA